MAITVTVTINDIDEKVLLNDLLDINEWVQSAVSGKINNCWSRMQTNCLPTRLKLLPTS